MTKPVMKVLKGETLSPPPIWMMRQAGRYLPEYREIRKDHANFLDMVYSPQTASEITMQPVRRYEMDGAILFSDILVVPDALGQKVRFEEGRGPVLDPVRSRDALGILDKRNVSGKFHKISETVSVVSAKLKTEGFDNTVLIGFAGSPWTVACYMVEGSGSREFMDVKRISLSDPEFFEDLLCLLSETTVTYLDAQIKAGAEVIQLFDSWAGIVDDTLFERCVLRPTAQIVSDLKKIHPDIPIIGFPKGSAARIPAYIKVTAVDAVSLDYTVPLDFAKLSIPRSIPVQGNLDPCYLLSGKKSLEEQTERLLNTFSDRPYIFNLGHGVNKNTDPQSVGHLVEFIRAKRR